MHKFLDQETLLTVTYALVISLLDYYNMVYIGLNLCKMWLHG